MEENSLQQCQTEISTWDGSLRYRRAKGFGAILKVAVQKGHMLNVAIVGCGKIADDHAEQIQRIKNCQIVGVCDRELLMARQLYLRFRSNSTFIIWTTC